MLVDVRISVDGGGDQMLVDVRISWMVGEIKYLLLAVQFGVQLVL
jgi:hypothetical protein